ncbi:Dihydrolipoamide acetyltransferase [Enhygromyxa salina]|uniref:Dihydrolipoamide acetyltransferase n=1 Tax=Enhygromyxa salina TaxID=215803 RepID=A0A0C2CRE3_9BACT|nr:Dihydrolipoamide acetyltransferase [Enhygromyxa salina]
MSHAAPPPATGQAIPPDDLPQNQPTAEPEPPAEDDDAADLFQTTETPDGVDSSRRESEIYGARIDGLQGEVDDLKERIFRSKARLSVLKETVLHGVLAGSRVIIAHRNLMGSQFRLTKLAVILDGAQIYARTDDSGTLDQEDELTVLDGNIVPGPHTITVELTYQGQGFGVFSYLNGYTFESRSSHNFTAPENGSVRLLSSGFEKGNVTTEMKDRPSIDWQEIPLDASGKPLPQVQRKPSKSPSKSKSKSKSKPATKKPSEPASPTPTANKPAQKPAAQKPAAQKPAAGD